MYAFPSDTGRLRSRAGNLTLQVNSRTSKRPLSGLGSTTLKSSLIFMVRSTGPIKTCPSISDKVYRCSWQSEWVGSLYFLSRSYTNTKKVRQLWTNDIETVNLFFQYDWQWSDP